MSGYADKLNFFEFLVIFCNPSYCSEQPMSHFFFIVQMKKTNVKLLVATKLSVENKPNLISADQHHTYSTLSNNICDIVTSCSFLYSSCAISNAMSRFSWITHVYSWQVIASHFVYTRPTMCEIFCSHILMVRNDKFCHSKQMFPYLPEHWKRIPSIYFFMQYVFCFTGQCNSR